MSATKEIVSLSTKNNDDARTRIIRSSNINNSKIGEIMKKDVSTVSGMQKLGNQGQQPNYSSALDVKRPEGLTKKEDNKSVVRSLTEMKTPDHDYTVKAPTSDDKNTGISEKPEISNKSNVIIRVSNIDELKKLTPKLKLLSPDVTSNLSQLSTIKTTNLIQESDKDELEALTGIEPSRYGVKDYCRTCAGLKVPLVDIFSEKGIQMRLNQQLKHLEDIKQDDSLSTGMCMDCICDLKMSYKFFMQIKKAQVKLQSIQTTLEALKQVKRTKILRSPEKPTIQKTTIEKMPIEKPTIEKTAVEKPTSEKPVNEKPTVENPTTEKPTVENPTTEKPTDENPTPEKPTDEITETNPQIKIEPNESSDWDDTAFQSSDNESLEEFDPEDPPPVESDATEPKKPRATIAKEKNTVAKTVGRKTSTNESSNIDNKMVYQYDATLKAYVKVDPPTPPPPPSPSLPAASSPKAATKTSLTPQKKDNNSSKSGLPKTKDPPISSLAKQSNILKRKIPLKENLAKLTRRSTGFPIKKPKLNVENPIVIKKEKEEGIIYVTVKGTKPNEMLLVKVKKMDKSSGDKKKDDRMKEKGKSGRTGTQIGGNEGQKDASTSVDGENDCTETHSKSDDIREQSIAHQIEEYKKRREQILGGSAGLPNALKFEDGMIRFVNPIDDGTESPTEKDKDKETNEDESKDVDETNQDTPADESKGVDKKKTRWLAKKKGLRKFEWTKLGRYSNNTGEYLSRLAKLKRKWEEAKRKKESLQRELAESSTKGNMEKIARILGEKEKNLGDFKDYLKQRKIVINRLKDEDIISLYMNCKNNDDVQTVDQSSIIDQVKTEPSTSLDDEEISQNIDYLDCDYCIERFQFADQLEDHEKTHDYKLMYYCEDCQEEYPTIKAKRSHNMKCMKKLICRYCDAMLDSRGKKRQHEQKHVDNVYGQLCDVCGEKFKHQGTLDQHLKTQHMTWEKVHECPKCPKKFAFKQKLSFHLKSVHTNMRAYLCEDCGADFKNPASLRHHRMRKHHPTGNKRECPVCNKLVPFYSLSKHMYTHKAYTIQCPHCDKMFKNSSTLKQHLRIHEDQRQYRCDTCGVGFNRRDGLRLHMRVHQKSNSRSLKECSCQICSEKFPNHSMLVIHRNRVHKDGRQYTCHICNRSMLSPRSLEWHMSHIHNIIKEEGVLATGSSSGSNSSRRYNNNNCSIIEKKRVLCVHCDKTFKTEMILRTHIKNTHMKKDPTKCLDCDQAFTSDVRLRHHMMIAHNRIEGTLPCPHCDKRFVNQLRLKTHMISHSEDRPYTCEICGFNLKTKIQLIKHHQNRHSDERPLQCRYCPWRCKQVSALVCHERTHTNERPYTCVVCRQRFKYLGDKNKHERRHESLGGSGFKRIVGGRNFKPPNTNINDDQFDQNDTSNSEQDQIDDEQTQTDSKDHVILDESDEAHQEYQQEYEETSRETSEATEVIMSMEDTTVYTEEVTAENIETAEIITDEIMTNEILQSGTVVHLQQQDKNGKIQVIPVMISLPDLSDSSAEVDLASTSIIYND